MTRSGAVRLGWVLFAAAAAAFFVAMTWHVLTMQEYRIDVDVYRMGAQAWLDGRQLYGDAVFETWVPDDPLPFTYPPVSAVLFTPFTVVSLYAATSVMVVVTAVLLAVSVTIVAARLDVCTTWWQRAAVAAAAVATAIALDLEPIMANFAYGQINAVLMTLVLADCLSRRTYWPRGLLVGLAISIKLTPAVFLLYFVLRGDRRAVLTSLATFAASVAAAFALAPKDSWEYWTSSLFQTSRIGDTDLNTNQNIAGFLARVGVSGLPHFLAWTAACLAVLALTVWAARRLLRARADGDRGEGAVLALICVALFGLLVSPVSWSHHWVWSLPTVTVAAIVGYRWRNAYLVAMAVAGIGLARWAPLQDIRTDSSFVVEVVGAMYVWWALAVVALAGLATPAAMASTASEPDDAEPDAEPARS